MKIRPVILCAFVAVVALYLGTPEELLASSRVISRAKIPGRGKVVALTIDDGPHSGYTERLLAILREAKVKATFFLVGRMAATTPELVRQELAEGHTLGNHSHYHNNLLSLPPEGVVTEWRMCNYTVRSITGEFPRFCRPPGGNYDASVLEAASAEGLTAVLWTANAADCTGLNSRDIAQKVLSQVSPGGIILIHDGVEATVQALPHILSTLKKKGYTFVTLDEVLPVSSWAEQPSSSSSPSM